MTTNPSGGGLNGWPAATDRGRQVLPAPRPSSLARARLYLCTPDRPDLGSFALACIRGGVDVVQLREKHLAASPLIQRAKLLKAICADLGVPFIVNDRPDIALEAGADGVHVGQDDVPPALARRILGPDALVGLSTHGEPDLAGTLGAAGEPLDYISAGPVVVTPTKPTRPAVGTGYIAAATARSRRPVFVTGGVTPQSVPGLVAAGARHFVVVRWLTGSTDPEGAARAVRLAIDAAVEAAGDTAPSPR